MKPRHIPGAQNYSVEFIRKTSLKALNLAIKIAGGHNKFIKELNIYAGCLAAWKVSKYGVDPRYVLTIQRLTHGAVSADDLRIDIFNPF